MLTKPFRALRLALGRALHLSQAIVRIQYSPAGGVRTYRPEGQAFESYRCLRIKTFLINIEKPQGKREINKI